MKQVSIPSNFDPDIMTYQLQVVDPSAPGGFRRARHDEVQGRFFWTTGGWRKFDACRYLYDNDDIQDPVGDCEAGIDHFIDFGAYEGQIGRFNRALNFTGSVMGRNYSGELCNPLSSTHGECFECCDGAELPLSNTDAYMDNSINKANGWYMDGYVLFKCEPPCTATNAHNNGRQYTLDHLLTDPIFTSTGVSLLFDPDIYLKENPSINAMLNFIDPVTGGKIYFDGSPLEPDSSTPAGHFLSAGAWEGQFGRGFTHNYRTNWDLGRYVDGAENQHSIENNPYRVSILLPGVTIEQGFKLMPNSDSDPNGPFTNYGMHLCVCTDMNDSSTCRWAIPADIIGTLFYSSRGWWEPFDEDEYLRINPDVAYMVKTQMWYDTRTVPRFGMSPYSPAQHFIDFGAWEGQYGRNFSGFGYNLK